jgi:hypothetical protein
LVRRDSSIVTGTSIVSLNPDYVTALRWWEYPDFSKREYLEAAEVVAFKIFDPVLRSRGNPTERGDILLKNEDFLKKMETLFNNKPTGTLELPDFQDLLERLNNLETEIQTLKKGS